MIEQPQDLLLGNPLGEVEIVLDQGFLLGEPCLAQSPLAAYVAEETFPGADCVSEEQILAAYDKHLWERFPVPAACDRMAFALSAYNGGETRLQRERAMAFAARLSSDAWWDSTERFNAGRSEANWRENRGYPKRILRQLEPVYRAAGWGAGSC